MFVSLLSPSFYLLTIHFPRPDPVSSHDLAQRLKMLYRVAQISKDCTFRYGVSIPKLLSLY